MMPLNRNVTVPAQPMVTGEIDVEELLRVTAQLKVLLEQESAHLKAMEIKEVAKLRGEKEALTKRMEAYQKLLVAQPDLLRNLDAGIREELVELSEGFSRALAENMRRTAVARAVNQRVVGAIMEVVSEANHAGIYNKRGAAPVPGSLAVSFNLNQQA
jgi:hypothetical protein